jgi:hypothetical protein
MAKRINIALPPRVLRLIDQAAKAAGESRSDYVARRARASGRRVWEMLVIHYWGLFACSTLPNPKAFKKCIRRVKMKNFIIYERLFFAGALSLFMGACSLPCQAADIQIKYSDVYIDGEIRPGDAERLAVALSQARFDVSQLTVNSMGGDVREALRIAGLVRGTKLEVKVAKGGFCVSSCFFIFWTGFLD